VEADEGSWLWRLAAQLEAAGFARTLAEQTVALLWEARVQEEQVELKMWTMCYRFEREAKILRLLGVAVESRAGARHWWGLWLSYWSDCRLD
jgi:hypothetical protein